jgi:hypothetical protein
VNSQPKGPILAHFYPLLDPKDPQNDLECPNTLPNGPGKGCSGPQTAGMYAKGGFNLVKTQILARFNPEKLKNPNFQQKSFRDPPS